MDWDVLFLIPTIWAGPVTAPVIVSLVMLTIAVTILYRSCGAKPLKLSLFDWFIFALAALLAIASFCIAGLHVAEPDFKSHFHWLLFAAGPLSAAVTFTKCLLKSG
jgi:hypothetical protein